MSAGAPLAGLRVLDLSRDGGARVCSRLLRMLGAHVDAKDAAVLRVSPLLVRRGQDRPPVASASYDVVVIDLRPGEGAVPGVEALDVVGPGQVVVSVTPFGLDGPDAAAGDAALATGWLGARAAAELAGAHAAVAALGALRWARRHGRGACVEVATCEMAAACLGDALPPVICPLPQPDPAGVTPPGARLVVLPCADGYVGVSAPSPEDRAHLAALTGIDSGELERGDLEPALLAWLRNRRRAEIFQAAQAWRLPVVPVLSPAEVVDDEQCRARGFWRGAPDGRPAPGSPFRYTAPPGDSSVLLDTSGAGRRARPRGNPLADIRVLDLGMVWAGPYCGRLLAGLGAEVIKVEGPTRPDGTRPSPFPSPPGGRGKGEGRRMAAEGLCQGAFADLNQSKASLVLDLASARGRALFLRLAANADAIIENFSPRVMGNFGLDYGNLARTNAGLVMLSLPAFGATGPWANYVAYGSGIELAAGLARYGDDGIPHPAPIPYVDYLAGAYGALGVLAGLLARDASGRGTHIELAQREVACQVHEGLGAGSWGLGARGQRAKAEGQGLEGVEAFDTEAIVRDPHLIARGLFVPRSAPRSSHSCRHYARLPWRLHGIGQPAERAAPGFGSDSRRILRRYTGLEAAEIDTLIRDGVAGAPVERTHPSPQRSPARGKRAVEGP